MYIQNVEFPSFVKNLHIVHKLTIVQSNKGAKDQQVFKKDLLHMFKLGGSP